MELYPRFAYHATKAPDGRLVKSEEDEPTGAGWVDTPAKFDPDYVAPPEADGSLTLTGHGVYVPIQFPAHVYNRKGEMKEVASAEALEALDPAEWKDSPAAFEAVPERPEVKEPPVVLTDDQQFELWGSTVEVLKETIADVSSPAMLAAIETAEALNPKGPRSGVLKAIAARRHDLTS